MSSAAGQAATKVTDLRREVEDWAHRTLATQPRTPDMEPDMDHGLPGVDPAGTDRERFDGYLALSDVDRAVKDAEDELADTRALLDGPGVDLPAAMLAVEQQAGTVELLLAALRRAASEVGGLRREYADLAGLTVVTPTTPGPSTSVDDLRRMIQQAVDAVVGQIRGQARRDFVGTGLAARDPVEAALDGCDTALDCVSEDLPAAVVAALVRDASPPLDGED
jgi:hypothetical protein